MTTENYFDFDRFAMMTGEMYDNLLEAAKVCGTYDPEEILPYIEEGLTQSEYEVMESFFTWLHDNKKTFGWNLVSVFGEFYEQATQEQKDLIDGK